MDFAVPSDHRGKKQRKRKEKQVYLGLARELTAEHESNDDTNCNWCTWNDLQRVGTGTGKVGNQRMDRDHLNLLRWTRILRRVLETGGDLQSFRPPSTKADVKNSQEILSKQL